MPTEWNKEITINLSGSGAPERPRYMYVLFTLENRTYSVDDACALSEKLRDDGIEDLHCIKVDLGDDPFPRSFDGLKFLNPGDSHAD